MAGGSVVGSLRLEHVTYFTVPLSWLVLPRNVLRKRKGHRIRPVHLFTVSSPVSLPELANTSHLQGSFVQEEKEKNEGILSHLKCLGLPVCLCLHYLRQWRNHLFSVQKKEESLSLGGLRRLVHTSVTDTVVFGLVRWWREPWAEGSDSPLSTVCVCVCVCVCSVVQSSDSLWPPWTVAHLDCSVVNRL